MPTSDPSPEVMAIIVAAVEALRPRVVVATGPRRRDDESPSWRFSGRHWTAPIAANRSRPRF